VNLPAPSDPDSEEKRPGAAELERLLKISHERLEASYAMLAESEARLAEVTQRTKQPDRTWQLSQDLLMVARLDATLVAVNPAWSTTLGWTEAELVGQLALDLIHPADYKATLAEMGRLAAGMPTRRFLNRYRHQNGSWHWFAWTALLDEGLVYATGRDGTEDQLHQSQRMETMGQLSGVRIAHDFNNVLQGIGGNLEMLQLRLEQGRPAEAIRYIETMHKGVDHAAALTVRLRCGLGVSGGRVTT
jgi:PAS domain S-box-containing protein